MQKKLFITQWYQPIVKGFSLFVDLTSSVQSDQNRQNALVTLFYNKYLKRWTSPLFDLNASISSAIPKVGHEIPPSWTCVC